MEPAWGGDVMRCLPVLVVLLFALPAQAVTIDWVTVGDLGNPADTEVIVSRQSDSDHFVC